MVSLVPTEEGYSVSCPGLPGCWSQGATEQEALDNIQDAITEYLEVVKELAGPQNLREVEIPAVGGIVRETRLTPAQFRELL